MPNELNANAQKWVDALRSGKYTQTRGALRNDEGNNPKFCCLGVACDLYAKETNVDGWRKIETGLNTLYKFVSDESSSEDALPESVAEWLGLNSVEGEFDPELAGLKVSTLIALNDDHDMRYDFKKIADVIESQPEGLFNA